MGELLKDMRLDWSGDGTGDRFTMAVTFASTHELDKLCGLLDNLRPFLSSHRIAIPGDFGIEVPRVPFAERIKEFLG